MTKDKQDHDKKESIIQVRCTKKTYDNWYDAFYSMKRNNPDMDMEDFTKILLKLRHNADVNEMLSSIRN